MLMHCMCPNIKNRAREFVKIIRSSFNNNPKLNTCINSNLFRCGYSVSQNVENIICKLNENRLDQFYNQNGLWRIP